MEIVKWPERKQIIERIQNTPEYVPFKKKLLLFKGPSFSRYKAVCDIGLPLDFPMTLGEYYFVNKQFWCSFFVIKTD